MKKLATFVLLVFSSTALAQQRNFVSAATGYTVKVKNSQLNSQGNYSRITSHFSIKQTFAWLTFENYFYNSNIFFASEDHTRFNLNLYYSTNFKSKHNLLYGIAFNIDNSEAGYSSISASRLNLLAGASLGYMLHEKRYEVFTTIDSMVGKKYTSYENSLPIFGFNIKLGARYYIWKLVLPLDISVHYSINTNLPPDRHRLFISFNLYPSIKVKKSFYFVTGLSYEYELGEDFDHKISVTFGGQIRW